MYGNKQDLSLNLRQCCKCIKKLLSVLRKRKTGNAIRHPPKFTKGRSRWKSSSKNYLLIAEVRLWVRLRVRFRFRVRVESPIP